MTLRATLGRNLRNLRAERGLSQEKLALEAGIDRSYVSLLETEKYAASIDVIEKLAMVLKVDASQLLAVPERTRRSK